ncbi:MAG: metallophosphatase family protein [Lachnospiraceae bacterium]|nr:metallophosphatase family protein [Lachnospiraceae bacterium]
MIYLAGDIHGNHDIQKVIDFFELESLMHVLTKQDYLIILGDVAVCWDDDVHDEWVKKTLQMLPVTVLWLDGNHENFDVLSAYPVRSWNGGKVHQIAPDILHLMRGQCFEIDGRKIWTFGGGYSIDKMYRTEGISWWPQEMPNEEEYERGMEILKQENFQVDYILTHTAPREVVESICNDIVSGEEELQYYLQRISQKADFKKWYFGHWHMDVSVGDKYQGLMEDVICLG